MDPVDDCRRQLEAVIEEAIRDGAPIISYQVIHDEIADDYDVIVDEWFNVGLTLEEETGWELTKYQEFRRRLADVAHDAPCTIPVRVQLARTETANVA